MSLHVCSLINDAPQSIPADGGYHLLRFPFGSLESSDVHGMHQMLQPDSYQVTDWETDDRSGLIWPAVAGWGTLWGMVHWASGGYTEVRSQFARDPLGLAGGLDTTATEDDQANAGGQYRVKVWGLFTDPGTPLGIRVRHNASAPVAVTFAEFKMAIDDDVAAQGGQ